MKIPPVGTDVKILWVDSGIQHQQTGVPDRDIECSRSWLHGQMGYINVERGEVVIWQQHEFPNPDPNYDNRICITIDSIEELVILKVDKVQKRGRK